MKILDRYLLKQMMLPFVVCLVAFTMIWVVIDLFNHFGDFVQGQSGFKDLLRYYVLLIPSSLTTLVPAALIMAELYCLSKLTRHSELTAMRACGLSLSRLMRPLLLVGLASSLVVLIVNESVGPRAAYQTDQFVRSQHLADKSEVYRYSPLPYQNRRQHRQWFIGEFNALNSEMTNVEVVQRDETGMDLFKITAPRVQWLDGRWWFNDMHIQFYDASNNPRGAPRVEKGREMPDFSETPQDFLNEALDPEFLGVVRLARYISLHGHLTGRTLTRYKVDLHYRLATPWSCFVVSLLGLPLGSQTGRRGAMKGILGCLALFFMTYVLISIGLHAGKEEWIPAWLAGWGPLLLIGAYGYATLLRMR